MFHILFSVINENIQNNILLYKFIYIFLRFHDKALEPSMNHKVLPPLRDDIQLAVDDYRNKLYELMGRNKVKNKKR